MKIFALLLPCAALAMLCGSLRAADSAPSASAGPEIPAPRTPDGFTMVNNRVFFVRDGQLMPLDREVTLTVSPNGTITAFNGKQYSIPQNQLLTLNAGVASLPSRSAAVAAELPANSPSTSSSPAGTVGVTATPGPLNTFPSSPDGNATYTQSADHTQPTGTGGSLDSLGQGFDLFGVPNAILPGASPILGPNVGVNGATVGTTSTVTGGKTVTTTNGNSTTTVGADSANNSGTTTSPSNNIPTNTSGYAPGTTTNTNPSAAPKTGNPNVDNANATSGSSPLPPTATTQSQNTTTPQNVPGSNANYTQNPNGITQASPTYNQVTPPSNVNSTAPNAAAPATTPTNTGNANGSSQATTGAPASTGTSALTPGSAPGSTGNGGGMIGGGAGRAGGIGGAGGAAGGGHK